jgi:uncharacterized protein YcbK (DUF882 family)
MKLQPRILSGCLVALASFTGAPAPAAWMSVPDRQARPSAADGTSAQPLSGYIIVPLPPEATRVTLHNVNNDETETFAIATDGTTDAATTAALKHFLRCRRTQREKRIATGTLALLVSVAQHWPDRVIDVVSGFRAPPFGAPHSKHFAGHAIDLRIEGVKTSTIRDFVWRGNHQVGVGHYTDENFVHMDWRPGEGDKAWSSRSESDALNYNPRWAWSARHPQAARHGRTSPRS